MNSKKYFSFIILSFLFISVNNKSGCANGQIVILIDNLDVYWYGEP